MIQLQSVLLPVEEVCAIPELYFHKSSHRIDFNGYFNLFYIEKRKKYTELKKLFLDICLHGFKELIIVHDGVDLDKVSLDSLSRKSYQIEFPLDRIDTGVFWFALIEDGQVDDRFINGFFTTQMSPECISEVNIGIDICTFKRESYVARNLKQLKTRILDQSTLDVSKHISIFIIDNGRTLDTCEPVQDIVRSCGKKITVFQNENAGGAGGFTRGMLEILKVKQEKQFTHVLVMDDDAIIEPDLLVRIYGFLSTIKTEWKQITVGGAMLREDYPYMLFCAGEWWERGAIINPEMHLDLRKWENATNSYLTETGHEHDRYSGWWCCCYSLDVVREDNLPIPLFIHHDDIEFGLRNKKVGVVFLNGVGVWHRGAELAFPGANIYYDTRNNLIEIALHQPTKCYRTAKKIMFRTIVSAIFRLKYKDALLAYQGLADFLKGPQWLWEQQPDLLNSTIRSMTYQMQPIEQIKEALSEKEAASVQLQIQQYLDNYGIDTIVSSRVRKTKATLLHLLTFNGWLLPPNRAEVKVILPTDSPFDTFRKRKVVLYEPTSGRAVILERKYGELIRVIGIYVKSLFTMSCYFDSAVKNYRNNIDKFTNKKAWEEYLKIK